MRKPDQALEAFERAVEADPRDGYTRRNLGGMLIGFKRIDEAVVHLRQALQLMPDDPQAIFGLATALEQIGTLDADEEGVIVSFQQIDTVAADQPIAGPSRPPGR
jgi:tetratricopeptide (TPR) repeat protein